MWKKYWFIYYMILWLVNAFSGFKRVFRIWIWWINYLNLENCVENSLKKNLYEKFHSRGFFSTIRSFLCERCGNFVDKVILFIWENFPHLPISSVTILFCILVFTNLCYNYLINLFVVVRCLVALISLLLFWMVQISIWEIWKKSLWFPLLFTLVVVPKGVKNLVKIRPSRNSLIFLNALFWLFLVFILTCDWISENFAIKKFIVRIRKELSFLGSDKCLEFSESL